LGPAMVTMCPLKSLVRDLRGATGPLIHRRSWPNLESTKPARLEWVPWFNHLRLLGAIGYFLPAQAGANYRWKIASQTTTAMAELNPTGI
jgi:hypothetical protein